MGEFGAVSVVSGHIRGLTNTMPLHVEILYNEYNFVGAFAVASLLALLALVTLVVKIAARNAIRRRDRRDAQALRNKAIVNGSIASPNVAKSSTGIRHCATSRWTSTPVSCWRCWDRPARARRRCCGSSPASSGRLGRDLFRRRGCFAAHHPGAQRRLRFPALRPVPAYDGVRQHRLRLERPAATTVPPDAEISTA